MIIALGVAGYLAGRTSGHGVKSMAIMEMNAAARTAKLEADHTYERYRIATVRMEWVGMAVEAKKEYVRLWGRPSWAHPSRAREQLLEAVSEVRGR